MQIHIKYENLVEFPMVTICSMKKLHCGFLTKEIQRRGSSNNNNTADEGQLENLCKIYHLVMV